MAKEIIHGDRRLQRRYPIELDLEYKIIADDRVVSRGTGKTENISSGGVLFQPMENVTPGRYVELSVRWPAVLGNVQFLELCISGKMVRSDSRGVALRMSRYHFQKLDNLRAAFDDIFTSAVIQ